MSKASEFAKAVSQKSPRYEIGNGDTFMVSQSGECEFHDDDDTGQPRWILTPQLALALAAWIQDTFEEPPLTWDKEKHSLEGDG